MRPMVKLTYPPVGGANPLTYLKNLDAALLQRLNDLRATIDELERMNERGFASPWSGRVGSKQNWIDGSFFRRCIDLDRPRDGTSHYCGIRSRAAWLGGSAPNFSQRSSGNAGRRVCVIRQRRSISARKPSPNRPCFLSGAEDALIIGLGKRVAEMGGAPQPTADNPHRAHASGIRGNECPGRVGIIELFRPLDVRRFGRLLVARPETQYKIAYL